MTVPFPLPIGAAITPDNSTNNAPAGIGIVKSSAGAPTPFFEQANFDAAIQEWLWWSFQIPSDYASGLTVRWIFKMASATSGNVVFEFRVAAQSGGDSADVDAIAPDSANTTSAIAVPGTAGYPSAQSQALSSLDSIAANDFVVFGFSRDADNGSDTASGDLELIAVTLEYTPA